MSWQLFLTVNIFFYSLTVLLQKVLIKESNSKPIAYSIFFQLFAGIFVAIFGFFLYPFTLPRFTPMIIYSLILGTFLYAFANVFIFKALKATEASKFTVIFSTRVLFTVLASTLLLNESFSPKEILGALLIFIGIAVVSLKSKKFIFNKGDFYGMLAAVLFGFANSNARFLLHSFTVYPYMMYVLFTPVVLLSVIYPKEIHYVKIFMKKRNLINIFLLSIIYGIANLGFFEAVKRGPSVSLVSTVQLLSVIVTVILSIIFLKERTSVGKKLLGAVISFIGLAIISLP